MPNFEQKLQPIFSKRRQFHVFGTAFPSGESRDRNCTQPYRGAASRSLIDDRFNYILFREHTMAATAKLPRPYMFSHYFSADVPFITWTDLSSMLERSDILGHR